MANTVRLPAAGRAGKTPPWPLGGRTPAGWKELWRKPQAIMWDKQGSHLLVARYVVLRNLVQNPQSLEDVNAAAWAELRQLEDRLGLSPMAMLRLRWEIVDEMEADSAAPATSDLSTNVIDLQKRARSTNSG